MCSEHGLEEGGRMGVLVWVIFEGHLWKSNCECVCVCGGGSVIVILREVVVWHLFVRFSYVNGLRGERDIQGIKGSIG